MFLAALGRSYGPNPWIVICSMTLLAVVYFTAIIIWVMRRTKINRAGRQGEPSEPSKTERP